MPSTFIGLNIGSSGLYTYQAALNTTGHNVANAETDGYSRQVVNQRASDAISVSNSYGMAGTGVDVTGVAQIRSEYFDIKYWKNSAIYGEYSTKAQYMLQIENYFNEMTSDGYTVEFGNFFKALDEVAKDTTSIPNRTALAVYGESFSQYFNSLATNLQRLQTDANFEIKNQVEAINTKSQQIAALNKQINKLEAYGGTANDLRDQRALLVDGLSQIANVTVKETFVGNGVTTYTVTMNGFNLVDTNEYCALDVVPREKQINQGDAVGLYDVVWSGGILTGQAFDLTNPNLGGTLQGLVQIRDGNNADNFSGRATGTAGQKTVTLTNTSVNDISKLNIPASGVIVVDNKEYEYNSFECVMNNGAYEYTFDLKEPLGSTVTNVEAGVGKSIDYKGIPFYMAKLDEFVRTFASSFNEVHKSGQDLNGEQGIEFFNYKDILPEDEGRYKLDEEATSFKSDEASYYRMTALNMSVTKDISKDPTKIACAKLVDENGNPWDIGNGKDNADNLHKLMALQDDKSMFKQGKPSYFLQSIVAEMGIETDKALTFAESQEDLLVSIVNQRLSRSGVDLEEEGMNLVRFQNAYNMSAKVISVLNEIYDKLINQMGV